MKKWHRVSIPLRTDASVAPRTYRHRAKGLGKGPASPNLIPCSQEGLAVPSGTHSAAHQGEDRRGRRRWGTLPAWLPARQGRALTRRRGGDWEQGKARERNPRGALLSLLCPSPLSKIVSAGWKSIKLSSSGVLMVQ